MKNLIKNSKLLLKAVTLLAATITIVCATCLTGSAASVNATEIELYGLRDWAEERISIPEGSDSFQIKVSGATDVSYYVLDGYSATVSDSGLVEIAHNNMVYSSDGTYKYDVTFGKTTIRVVAGNEKFDIKVTVTDYVKVYGSKVMDDYIAKNITSDMTEYQKLDKICQFVAGYDYDVYCSSGYALTVWGGGDCWASTDAILIMCEKVGIDAWARNGAKDPGAGSGHRDVMAYCDGKYYEADAGFVGTAPRHYFLAERTSLFSSRITDYDNKEIEIYQYDGKDDVTSLEIPAVINGYTVKSIAPSSFGYLYDLKTVKLPDTIEKIGAHAFSCNYSSLETLEIPKNVKEIGDNPFENCTLLDLTVNKGNSYFTVRDGMLYTKDMKKLISANRAEGKVVVSDGVSFIGPYAFRGNEMITEVVIPSSVTEIGEGAFGECIKLKTVTINGNNLVTIGAFAFNENLQLENIELPDSVESIGDAAFKMCSSLKKITIPSKVTAISKQFSAYSFSLKEVVIHNNVVSIGDKAFYDCDNLKGITVPRSVTDIGEMAIGYIFEKSEEIPREDYVINCYENSVAHQYAIDNDVNYRLVIPGVKDFGMKLRSDNSITLGWTRNADADGYILQQMKNGVWVNIANIKDNTVTSYKIGGLAAGTGYKFRAVAYITYEGKNHYSTYTAATQIYTNPDRIKNFAISGRGSNFLTVSWAKNTGATGYIIQEQANGVWKNIANIKNNATVTYKHTGLQPDSFHRYRMVAYRKDASGTAYSKYTSAFSGYTAPAMVGGFKVADTGIRDIALSWSKVASADGYVIDIYKDGKWSQLAKVGRTATSYKATGLASGTDYKFRIKSYATNGTLTICSTYSSAIAAKTEAFKVENLRMTNRGTDFISVRWDKTENAEGYMVYIYDSTGWKIVKTLTSPNALSYRITGLKSGTAYKITVKAFMSIGGEKVISDTATITATTL